MLHRLSLISTLVVLGITSAQAAISVNGIVPMTPNTSVYQQGAGNVINIQAAGADGVSYNGYSVFHIEETTVLNNSAVESSTTLGSVRGNSNLIAGQEAKIIVNEVIDSDETSVISAGIEVAGRAADVVIVNPAGIELTAGANNGKFVNINNLSLVSGEGIFSRGMQLEGYQIYSTNSRNYGKVIVKGGLDNSNLNLNLVGREVKILGNARNKTADLKLKNLNVVLAVGKMNKEFELQDHSSNSGTLLFQNSGTVIDVTDSISIVAKNGWQTDVYNDSTLLAKDVYISANGRINNSADIMADTIALEAQEINNVSGGWIQANKELSLSASDAVYNDDMIISNGKLNISSQNEVTTTRYSSIEAKDIVLKGDVIVNHRGSLVGETVELEAGKLQSRGKLSASKSLVVTGKEIYNNSAINVVDGDIVFNVGKSFENVGDLKAKNITIAGKGGITNSSNITAEQDLVMSLDYIGLNNKKFNRTGTSVSAKGQMYLRGDSYVVSGVDTMTANNIVFDGGYMELSNIKANSLNVNSDDTVMIFDLVDSADVNISADSIVNEGEIRNFRNAALFANRSITNTGIISSDVNESALLIGSSKTDRITNSGEIQSRALVLTAKNRISNTHSGLIKADSLNVSSENDYFHNDGKVDASNIEAKL